MAGDKDDQFFSGENIGSDDNAFLMAGEGDPHLGGQEGDDNPSPARKPIPSWKIVGGVMLVVLVGAGGFNYYRGMNRPGNDMPMPESVSLASSSPTPKSAPLPTPMPISPDPTMPSGAPSGPPTNVAAGAPAPNAVTTITTPTLAPPPGQAPAAAPAAVIPTAANAPLPVAMAAAVTAPASAVAPPVGPANKDDSDVVELRKRVKVLEGQVEALTAKKPSQKPASAPSAIAARPLPTSEKAPLGKKGKTAVAGKPAAESRPALTGLRLRNITEGQAWIEDSDGHTTVVGVGDSVAGAKITRIVPDAYRVDTDRGPVTFASTHQ